MVAENRIPHKSKAKNPVQVCWELFSAMKTKLGDKFTRKGAIDAAMSAGIAYYTARTQYQEWKVAGDHDAAVAQRFTPPAPHALKR